MANTMADIVDRLRGPGIELDQNIADDAAREIERLRDIERTAARVYRKYGLESDWAEWRDLGDALGLSTEVK
jgi:hypothetical protein